MSFQRRTPSNFVVIYKVIDADFLVKLRIAIDFVVIVLKECADSVLKRTLCKVVNGCVAACQDARAICLENNFGIYRADFLGGFCADGQVAREFVFCVAAQPGVLGIRG